MFERMDYSNIPEKDDYDKWVVVRLIENNGCSMYILYSHIKETDMELLYIS